MKKPLVILTGPTAVGKTSLSISLAKALPGEIISADSMQVYREMNIGTAKISENEMEGIPHYLVDCVNPDDDFNVVRFQTLAKDAISTIYEHQKTPIIVGGTGFYIQSVLYDIDFESKPDDESRYRKELEDLCKEKGPEHLHKQLTKVDFASAVQIHPNNVKRVIRALEFFYETNQPISKHNQEQKEKSSPYDVHYFVLDMPREELYQRIDQRVDLMIEEGLVEEVKSLMEKGYGRNLVSMQGLGYKEIYGYLLGEMSLDEAVYILKRDTRHFAKRQLTWFRREKEVVWIEKDQFDYNEEKMLEFILDKVKYSNR